MRFDICTGSSGGLLIVTFCFCALLCARPAAAQEGSVDFDYDIFLAEDMIAVWLDITPVLTQSKMEDLVAGLAIYITIEMEIEKPRPILPDQTLAHNKAAVLISHQLTEDIYRLKIINYSTRNYEFVNQLYLSDFLADSLVFLITPAENIDGDADVFINLILVSKSHSSNMLEGDNELTREYLQSEDSPDSRFFESVFAGFLKLIGFGKTSYRIKSPTFKVENLSSNGQ